MKNEYANPDKLSVVPTLETDEPVTVDSCAIGVEGGPALGTLTVAKIPGSAGGDDPQVGGQYIVTGHEAGPADCTGVPATPPTS